MFWILIGCIQIAVGLTTYRGGDLAICGLWNFGVSILSFAGIADIVHRRRRTVNNLTLFAVLGVIWGLFQLFVSHAWLQVLVIPIYVVLGALAQANKGYFDIVTADEKKREVHTRVPPSVARQSSPRSAKLTTIPTKQPAARETTKITDFALAIAFPLVGIIVGIVLLFKEHTSTRGIVLIALSVAAWVLWCVVLGILLA
jgi:hypothetical protein